MYSCQSSPCEERQNIMCDTALASSEDSTFFGPSPPRGGGQNLLSFKLAISIWISLSTVPYSCWSAGHLKFGHSRRSIYPTK